MTGAFGDPVAVLKEVAATGAHGVSAQQDMELVRRTLQGFSSGGAGFLRLYRPSATAAFSPRDTTLEGYPAAVEAMRALGFEPVERRAGGQLAIYNDDSLVIDLVAPHGEPRSDFLERFRRFSGLIAEALRDLGIDARTGAICGEYCPGDFSVNGEGRIKLAGIAQRIGKHGYHLGAVISVMPSASVKEAVEQSYRLLGLDFDPATFGGVASFLPDIAFDVLGLRLQEAIAESLGLIQRA